MGNNYQPQCLDELDSQDEEEEEEETPLPIPDPSGINSLTPSSEQDMNE